MSRHAFAHAFDVAAGQVAAGRVPFAILAVARADGLVRLDAFSPPDRPRVGTDAVCLLASITKPIVATAVMRLAGEARFPLAAPLGRWLPELDQAGLAPFSAWHVLSHTTGLADVPMADLLLAGAGRAELIARTIERGQDAAPGRVFRYATFTFDLLAEAVARALGRPFPAVLRETVLDPLGMADTTFDHRACGVRRAPIALGDWDGTLQPIPPGVDPEALISAYAALELAGGGLWASARDLVRFGRAMLRDGELDGTRLLSPPLLELMTREVTLGSLGDTGDPLTHEHYALGWGKPGPASPASPRAFLHGGVSGTRLLVDPAHDLVLVYLTGLWGGASEAIDDVVMAAYQSIE